MRPAGYYDYVVVHWIAGRNHIVCWIASPVPIVQYNLEQYLKRLSSDIILLDQKPRLTESCGFPG